MQKLMILDGNSIVNRAFYGVRLLTNQDGLYTNAIYGFLNILFKYMKEEQPTHLCVAFDVHAPTFRHKLFADYKAQRKGMPEELRQQMPVLKEVLAAMRIHMLEQEGYEADDLIGTVTRICGEQAVPCAILTGDKDDLQLADQNTVIKLITTRGGNTDTVDYTDQTVFEKYGVTPAEFIDVKGLMGDPSDNIPGVAGIGEKTAFSLIQNYKSIENIYAHLDTIDVTKRVRAKLEAGRDDAFNSKMLATIDRHVPVAFQIGDCAVQKYDYERLVPLLTKLNFTSFLKRLDVQAEQVESTVHTDQEALFAHIRARGRLFFWYDAQGAFAATSAEDLTEVALSGLKPFFEDASIQKISHNLKDAMVDLQRQGIAFENPYFDTMIAAYILNPSASEYPLEKIALEFTEKAYDHPLMMILKLFDVLGQKIRENGQKQLFYEVEMPLTQVLASMQAEGIRVDRAQLLAFQKQLEAAIEQLTASIYACAGTEFNINSPKQLGEVLFERLHLPVVKKTKSGYSTSVDVLEKLRGSHEIIEMIMEYRHLVKLKGTYADGLLAVIDPETGKIHSNFNQTVTATGRISSTDPNLQNIPVRTPLGREVRRMFTASDAEHILVDADYSQIELRVLAHIANDESMIQAFRDNIDIHTNTASQIFGVPPEAVTAEMRSRAKTVNFGIVYGMGDFSLAQDLHIRRVEAKAYIDSYFQNFQGVKRYMEDIVKQAREDGYVTTILNRRRYLPELQGGNFIQRAAGERIAMNTPIQGSAADIIKIAMVRVYRQLKERGLRSKLILQVHDELIIDAYRPELQQVRQILKEAMERAVVLRVPLVAEMNEGETWYDTK